MGNFFFKHIRLSWYFLIFLGIYLILAFQLSKTSFEGGTLALFSVNSFLYGFYLAPILSAQKTRIDDLHKIVRSEANAIFSMMLHLKKLPAKLRNEFQAEMTLYLHTVLQQRKVAQGEKEYEEMISDCLNYSGKHQDEIDKLLDALIANEQNRTQFAMQLNNRVFSHEWMVIMVLFSITISFILFIDGGEYIASNLSQHFCARD